MKLIKLSSKKEFAAIGADEVTFKWYVIAPNVKKFIEAIPFGTEVSIKSEKKADKKDHLTFIAAVKAEAPQEPVNEPEPANSEPVAEPNIVNPNARVGWQLTSDNTDAIAQMVAGTMIALQGHITLDNAETVMSRLFKHGSTLVK